MFYLKILLWIKYHLIHIKCVIIVLIYKTFNTNKYKLLSNELDDCIQKLQLNQNEKYIYNYDKII